MSQTVTALREAIDLIAHRIFSYKTLHSTKPLLKTPSLHGISIGVPWYGNVLAPINGEYEMNDSMCWHGIAIIDHPFDPVDTLLTSGYIDGGAFTFEILYPEMTVADLTEALRSCITKSFCADDRPVTLDEPIILTLTNE